VLAGQEKSDLAVSDLWNVEAMAKMGTLVVWLLLLCGLCTVLAEDYEICTYRDAACSEDKECTDGENGECETVDVEDTLNNLGAQISCENDEITGVIFEDGDCSATEGGQRISFANTQETGCLRFPSVLSNYYYTIECDDNICFSAESSVQMQDGSVKQMKEIKVGDMVESYDASGRRTFSEVFLVQHKDSKRRKSLKRISYTTKIGSASGHITLSSSHLIRASLVGDRFIAASKLSEGSTIYVQSEGHNAVEARVTSVKRVLSVYRNVHTMNDRIIVDGVMASSMQDVGPYWLMRTALLPLKVLHRAGLGELVERCDVVLHKLGKFAKQKKLLKI